MAFEMHLKASNMHAETTHNLLKPQHFDIKKQFWLIFHTNTMGCIFEHVIGMTNPKLDDLPYKHKSVG